MEAVRDELVLDRSQVKKAALALQAYIKSTSSSQKLEKTEFQPISLLFTLCRIPSKNQTIRISLPNGLRTESGEVCLFTRDEPNMTSEQTERFYKRLLKERGVQDFLEVIPFRQLMTEYKELEAKRRLLGNFDLFLADARIQSRLPSQIGKHFYERKKNPLSVDLESKHLARDIERLVQGTTLSVSKKGSCCMVRVAHTGMTADEITENVVTAASTIFTNIQMKGQNIKIIHMKTLNSAALPVYTSDLSHLTLVQEIKKSIASKEAQKRTRETEQAETPEDEAGERESEEEEIPQRATIKMPNKKFKQTDVAKKGLINVPKPAFGQKTNKNDKKTPKKTRKFKARGLKNKTRG